MADPLTLVITGSAGVLSFFSPCILPMLPAYLGHLAGVTLVDLENTNSRIQKTVFFHALLFILGFASIFILMGSALAFVGQQ